MMQCLGCAYKHLAKAEVLIAETVLGYPEHSRDVVGNMGLAEDHLVHEVPELAKRIREARMTWTEDGTVPDFDALFGELEVARRAEAHEEATEEGDE